MRRIFGVILAALVLTLAVTGCSFKDNKEMKDSKGNQTIAADKTSGDVLAKGKYVEEDLGFPDGVVPNEFIAITTSPSGELELYAYNNDAYKKYTYTDKKWSMGKVVAALKPNDFAINNFAITKIFYGDDKKQYLLGDNLSDNQCALYRLSDTDVFEKVELKRFEDTNEEWSNLFYRPKVIKVLKNGMIAAAYPWSTIEVYSPDGQSMIGEYHCGFFCVLAVEGNTLYYLDENDKELLSVNMETKKEGNPKSIDIPWSIGSDAYYSGVLELADGNTYICNSSGIHLNMEGSSLWETLLEGSQSSLSMPSERLKDFEVGIENECYILFSNVYNAEVSIKHVFYDENASSVPPTELSIFSIEDSPTIRQAIILYQESHPEVRINYTIANADNEVKYTYGLKNLEQTITLKDQMNALNTELLAGKGPDILVLDSMPIESYIDKGVLEDMGSIFNPLKASGELLSNITEPYYSDDKVYTMPLRFKLPFIYGASAAVNAANSTTELAEYARNCNEIPLLGPSNYRALAAWLFMIYYDQILNQENEIEEAALQEFLEDINVISAAIDASDDTRMSGFRTSGGRFFGYWMADYYKVYKKECQANIMEYGGMKDFALPLTVIQEWQGSLRAINHVFKATGLIGISSAGKQKELAKEFIQVLFGKEIQRQNLEGAFPINQAAMEEWIQFEDKDYYCIAGEEKITAYYPEKKARDKIYEYVCAADRPMVNDMVMMDMILDEAERYLRGDITAEQAASNAVESVNLYRSE